MDATDQKRSLKNYATFLFLLAFSLIPASFQAAQPDGRAGSVTSLNSAKGKSVREAPRHILVKLKAGADIPMFLSKASKRGLSKRGRVYGSNWYTLSIPSQANPRAMVAIARTLPDVVMATVDPLVSINQIPPRDPLYIDDDDPSAKSCNPVEEACDPLLLVDQWGLFQVGAEDAWNVTTGSASVVIAVIDSGTDLDHDDLIDHIWTNPGEIAGNGIDDDGNGFIDDIHGADFVGDNDGDPLTDNVASQDANPDIPMGGTWVSDPSAFPYGIRFDGDPAVGDAVDNNLDSVPDPGVSHGTLVAGIVASMTDNINPATSEFEGMAGACWSCKIMPVRMLSAEGTGYGSDAASAINYAVNMGADVLNLSWGFDIDSLDAADMAEVAVITDAINYAEAQGVIVVASAGNSGSAGLLFPAAMANTIAVGSSNWLKQRSDFSTFAAPGELPDNGIDDDRNGLIDDVLDIVAPGELIWSGYVFSAYDALLYQLLGDASIEPGLDSYGGVNGTSFSSPLVAGYVGLLLSRFPDATLSDVRQAIRSYALDLIDPEGTGSNLTGYDAFSGFGQLRMVIPENLGDPPPSLPPPPTPGPVIGLTLDVVDAGQYGYNYGTNQHQSTLAVTFQGDGTTGYQLQIAGYDIDSSDEVAVYVNDTFIVNLTPGPDNDLNEGDLLTLDPALLVDGDNTIEFRQRTDGFTWGVTNLGVLTPPPPPPPPPIIELQVDTVDNGQYGNNYGTNEHPTALIATFQGDGSSTYYLQITGYDIDYADEVAVYVNDTLLTHLGTGPDNGHNAGDVFTLDQSLLVSGENTIEFREKTIGWTWGVTRLGVLTTLPQPTFTVVELTLDVIDTGQYGYKYGTGEHELVLNVTFQLNAVTAYQLQVAGYDIDDSDEVAVYVNDTFLSYLATGPNNGHNAGDVFMLDPALLMMGENTLEFRQKVAGWTWGVTNIGVITPQPPPPPPPPPPPTPVIELTVDVVDSGQYGYNYGSDQHEISLFATFQGDGVSAYNLQVTGYDIDGSDEVAVYVNDTFLAYLATGPNNGHNAGDVFPLDPALLVSGENTLEFREITAGWTWGVTNIGVITPQPPPPPPPPPPPTPVIELTVDVVDSGQYGYNYGSDQHEISLFATFQGDGVSAYNLQVTGYDIDGSDEVAVYVNDTFLAYLATGPNNGHNAGDVFPLDPALLVSGENTLEFREITAGWTWGVTNIGVITPQPPPPPPPPPPPTPVIELTVDVVDSGQYGYNYGSDQHEISLFATFQGDGVSAYNLQVTGYDIDDADEISVYINGVLIGYLSKGRNNRLNDGDVFMLDPALLVSGKNSIEFRQKTAGWTWGVTNIGVITPQPPPPPPPPPPPTPVIELTVDVVDSGQYGYNYGSDQHEISLFATFQGDGVSAYNLQVTGYDIDDADEISVYINGVLIGYLSKGRNNRLNDGDVFMLDPALLVSGKNSIEFRQKTAGWTWGVTNIGVNDLGIINSP